MEEIIYFTDTEYIPPYFTQNDYFSKLRRQSNEKQQQKFINLNISKASSIRKRTTKPQILKGIVTKFKTDKLVRNFCKKIKRLVPNRHPIQFQLDKQSQSSLSNFIENKQGYEISDTYKIIIIIFSIIITAILTIFFSLKLVFSQISQNNYMKIVQKFALAFFLVDMLMRFTLKNSYGGKTLVYISEISYHYFTHSFILDLINILLILQEIFLFKYAEYDIIHLLIILKLIRLIFDLERFLEKLFITNSTREHITDLITVILINFSFAHMLAILLNAMTFINTENNWIIYHNLNNSHWYEKYAWGYYWGTNIMFTVGFGDFAATNYQQAICISIIQMFSCIILAYNINYTGNIINNLRLNNLVKKKKFKTFYQMNKNKKIPLELQKKIHNYIEGSSLIKKSFNFADQNQLLQSLSPNLKIQYLQQSQKGLFENLPLLKNWTNNIKLLLAQKIKKLITHPQSIIQQKGEFAKLLILEKGEIGFMYNQRGIKKAQFQIQKIQSKNLKQAKLTSLDFIKNKLLNYQIKALTYSILFYFQNQDLLNILKESQLDFQNFCFLRDHQQYILNENEIIKCQLCINEYHSKFKCPKIHYIPIKNHVIYKYNHIKQSFIQNRIPINRKRQKLKKTKRTREQKEYLKGFSSQKAFDSQNIYLAMLSQNSTSSQNITIKNIPRSQKQQQNIVKTDTIQQVIAKYLHFSNLQQINFWDIQCDVVHNWKYYYCEFNPINLSKRIKLKLRKR